MYIVFVVNESMGKRFDLHDAEEMGRYIMEHARKGFPVRVELYA